MLESLSAIVADEVANVYRQAGCWTWSDRWVWFDTEIFMEAPSKPVGLSDQGHLFPLNFFNIEPSIEVRSDIVEVA